MSHDFLLTERWYFSGGTDQVVRCLDLRHARPGPRCGEMGLESSALAYGGPMNHSKTCSSRSKPGPAAKRRAALKRFISGSAGAAVLTLAPERWVSPVVDSVVMPAHAVTSACTAAVIAEINGFQISSQPGFDIDFTVEFTLSAAGDISVRWTLFPTGGGSTATDQDLGFLSLGNHSATTSWTGLGEGQYSLLIEFFSCGHLIRTVQTGFELPINP